MKQNLLSIFGLVCLIAFCAFEFNQDKISDLRKNVSEIKSINCFNENFNDLKAIGESIGNDRIVMLGEHEHTDSTSAEAKNRVIKYLVKEKGFEVVLIESSMFDTWKKMELIKNGTHPLTAHYRVTEFPYLLESDFNFWQIVKEFTESKDTLIVGGIDLSYSYQFIDELEAVLSDLDNEYIKSENWNEFKRISNKLIPSKDNLSHQEAMLINFKKLTNEILKILDLKGHDNIKKPLWKQFLKNAVGTKDWVVYRKEKDLKRNPSQYHELRDKQLAANVKWFSNYYFPDKKIIVSASTYHISRNLEAVNSNSRKIVRSKPMGEYLWNEFRDNMYSIAFIEYSGETAGSKRNYRVCKKNKHSIERLLHCVGYKFSYLDLKNQDKSNWLKSEFIMSPTFNKSNLKGDWHKVYDGLFFSDNIKPNAYKRIPKEFLLK